MTLKSSTGLKNGLLVTGSLKSLLDLGKIRIFSGAIPADADAAETGTLLCVISNAGTATGVTFETTATAGAVTKNSSETWSGTNVAGGTATYFRFVANGDGGGVSTTDKRLQGTVGLAGADMNLSSTTLTSGAPQTIDYFSATVL